MLPAAGIALWLLFFVQATLTPILLDDWFQLRYWRDHSYSVAALGEYWFHNYFHYNPRVGDVLLAAIDGSTAAHLILTPLVQIAALVVTFVIAFARWPRRNLRDVQLLLFIQVMIWLVIPIAGILYFYRPFATNYLWAFTLTLALFVPYRLALAGHAMPRRAWLAPVMLVLGWIAGMCNEHTGPTAMVVLAGLVVVAYRRRQLRAWMVSGLVGLYVGYPMLFFAPGQRERYMGMATHATPSRLLADRGLTGCLQIALEFVIEARLGILIFVAAIVRYVVVRRHVLLPRGTARTAAILAVCAGAIVATLFASPMTTDRVLYAPGVLLVAACACIAAHLFDEVSVRRLVVGACAVLFAYHVVQFVGTYAQVKADNDDRLAVLAGARPGTQVTLRPYENDTRSRWQLGDDFTTYPWLAHYVTTELYDLAGVAPSRPTVRYRVARTYDPPLAHPPRVHDIPTYRQWIAGPFARAWTIAQLAVPGHQLERFAIAALGLPLGRPALVAEWTPRGWTTVVGVPFDDLRGHFIRVDRSTIPRRVREMYIAGCGDIARASAIPDGDALLLPVDERICRGAFTAFACEPDRCWVAGWY